MNKLFLFALTIFSFAVYGQNDKQQKIYNNFCTQVESFQPVISVNYERHLYVNQSFIIYPDIGFACNPAASKLDKADYGLRFGAGMLLGKKNSHFELGFQGTRFFRQSGNNGLINAVSFKTGYRYQKPSKKSWNFKVGIGISSYNTWDDDYAFIESPIELYTGIGYSF